LIAAVCVAAITTTACGDPAPREVECVEPANDVYVRSRNPLSQEPVFWQTGECVAVLLDHRAPEDLPQEQFFEIARMALTTWSDVECDTLCLDDVGLTNDATVEPGVSESGPNHNIIVFQTADEWADRFGN